MKMPKQNLRIPGPVSCYPEIMSALTGDMINHRGPEFKEMLYSATERLKKVFCTSNDLYILTASGTGALEASIVNVLSPGDRVLACIGGHFALRWSEMAEAHGAIVTRLEFEWGKPVEPEAVRASLRKDPSIKAVMLVHNESSTAVTNDVASIAKVVKGEFGKLLIVDAVSSLGCIPLETDAWGCDLVTTASQKGLLLPPGLSFISVSPMAWQAYNSARMPRYYFDLGLAKSYYDIGQTPFTPSLPLFYALKVALDRLLEDGLEAVFTRHAVLAQRARQGLRGLGLALLADDLCASNAVTAVKIPEGVEFGPLQNVLRKEYNVIVAGGLGKLNGKVFRIGHMGAADEAEIDDCVRAIGAALPKVGFKSRV